MHKNKTLVSSYYSSTSITGICWCPGNAYSIAEGEEKKWTLSFFPVAGIITLSC